MLSDGPREARIALILAHGAGAPMDSSFMNVIAMGVAARGIRVVRFEFPYMSARRSRGKRGVPDRESVLLDSWRAAIARVRAESQTVAIGGKSLGGRIASMVADEASVAGLVCLGYPFHPPGNAARARIAHLEHLRTPALILQGTRDSFGRPDEVTSYALAPGIRLVWIEDGDHSFKPRAASGRTEADNLSVAVAQVVEFVGSLN